MNPRLTKYLTMAVPRYTSYPTVPHFSSNPEPGQLETWLEALDRAEPVSLYLHVPFCRQLCWYCGCNMKLAARYEPVERYVASLIREIDLVADRLPARMTLAHLHWGGGTPTALRPDDLERTMDAVRNRFDLCPAAEVAIEADPRTLSEAMMARIGNLGFTRASIGVQEFDPRVQAAINRVQPPDMVAAVTHGLRQAGVAGINFDLIYGLPHQTQKTLLDTIDLCVNMQPDRLAMFGYAHVPWMAKKQRLIDDSALPGANERFAQSQAATQKLQAAGYQPIGIDHFARPSDPLAEAARNGTLHRNFQGYTTDAARTLLGVGTTSIGRSPGGYVQNVAETGAWERSIANGELPVAKSHALSNEDRLRGHVIEQLMCAGTADLEAAAAKFAAPPDWYVDESADLDALAEDGILSYEPECGRIQMSAQGRPFTRIAAAVFDTYFTQQRKRHSIAV